MNYDYKSKTIEELEHLADSLLKKHPKRVNGYQVDVEGILEDMGISLLPRPGIKKLLAIDAYLPRNKNHILIDEDYATDLPYFRAVIAEEISHRVIEPELWTQGVPPGANIYELDKQAYDDIESDAYRMGLAILMPRKQYTERYNFHLEQSTKIIPKTPCDDHKEFAIDKLSNDFDISFNAVASRGNHIGLFRGFIQKKALPGAVIL